MANNKKVLVAMSGGVDSSVCAALLKEQGYDVVGITLQIQPAKKQAQEDAQKVAAKLDIPHYALNCVDLFKKTIIANFIEEYKAGRTPNPCVRCNQFIKFNYLLQKAKKLGADFVATGHYARIKSQPQTSCLPAGMAKSQTNSNAQNPNQKYLLYKGRDPKKDQSYVLYTLNQEVLARTLFPLGELDKTEVRKIAERLGLGVADKEESQEICFIEDDDYNRFLREECPEAVKPGKILDINGKIVGEHQGIAFYTLGQRKGIGSHKGKPKYVVALDPKNNTVIIGDDQDMFKKELLAENVSYVSSEVPLDKINIAAKIRYNSTEAGAILYPLAGDKARVVFNKPQRAITPGQSVVFYDGEEVVGGGIINNNQDTSYK